MNFLNPKNLKKTKTNTTKKLPIFSIEERRHKECLKTSNFTNKKKKQNKMDTKGQNKMDTKDKTKGNIQTL